jgi:hypothetical protein
MLTSLQLELFLHDDADDTAVVSRGPMLSGQIRENEASIESSFSYVSVILSDRL